jgi:hypothetical protein
MTLKMEEIIVWVEFLIWEGCESGTSDSCNIRTLREVMSNSWIISSLGWEWCDFEKNEMWNKRFESWTLRQPRKIETPCESNLAVFWSSNQSFIELSSSGFQMNGNQIWPTEDESKNIKTMFQTRSTPELISQFGSNVWTWEQGERSPQTDSRIREVRLKHFVSCSQWSSGPRFMNWSSWERGQTNYCSQRWNYSSCFLQYSLEGNVVLNANHFPRLHLNQDQNCRELKGMFSLEPGGFAGLTIHRLRRWTRLRLHLWIWIRFSVCFRRHRQNDDLIFHVGKAISICEMKYMFRRKVTI